MLPSKLKKKLDSVTVGNIESDPLPFEHEQFDAIIFADVLEHTLDPWSVLAKVKPYFKKNRCHLRKHPKCRSYIHY